MFANRRASRVIFVQYIFSNLFEPSDLPEIINHLKNEDEDFICNEEFLNQLSVAYRENTDLILELFHKHNHRGENIDQLAIAVLISATTEMLINEIKVVIKEYLKISDILEINSKFIHRILDQIANDALVCEHKIQYE